VYVSHVALTGAYTVDCFANKGWLNFNRDQVIILGLMSVCVYVRLLQQSFK